MPPAIWARASGAVSGANETGRRGGRGDGEKLCEAGRERGWKGGGNLCAHPSEEDVRADEGGNQGSARTPPKRMYVPTMRGRMRSGLYRPRHSVSFTIQMMPHATTSTIST